MNTRNMDGPHDVREAAIQPEDQGPEIIGFCDQCGEPVYSNSEDYYEISRNSFLKEAGVLCSGKCAKTWALDECESGTQVIAKGNP